MCGILVGIFLGYYYSVCVDHEEGERWLPDDIRDLRRERLMTALLICKLSFIWRRCKIVRQLILVMKERTVAPLVNWLIILLASFSSCRVAHISASNIQILYRQQSVSFNE